MTTPNGGRVNFVTEAEDSFRALTWATTKMLLDGMSVMAGMGISPLTVIEGTLNSALDSSLSVRVFEVYTAFGTDYEEEDELYAY